MEAERISFKNGRRGREVGKDIIGGQTHTGDGSSAPEI